MFHLASPKSQINHPEYRHQRWLAVSSALQLLTRPSRVSKLECEQSCSRWVVCTFLNTVGLITFLLLHRGGTMSWHSSANSVCTQHHKSWICSAHTYWACVCLLDVLAAHITTKRAVTSTQYDNLDINLLTRKFQCKVLVVTQSVVACCFFSF